MHEGFIRERMSEPIHPCLFGDAFAIRQECLANVGPVVPLLSRKHDRRRHGRAEHMGDVSDVRRMEVVQMVHVSPVQVLAVEDVKVMLMVQCMQMVRMG
jgi:hypothetical protein